MIRLKLFVIGLLFLTSGAWAQKITLVQGNLKALKGLKGLNTEFVYTPMLIGRKGKTEEEYIAEKKAKFDQSEPGRGAKWEKAWVDDRKDRFEPQFRELFAKHSGMSTTDADSPYTLIFKTTRTEPGWNIGLTRVPAFIDAEAIIVDTNQRDKIIARIEMKNIPGRDAMGYDFETGYRLQEAYAKGGKELAGFMKKQMK